jgi:hypothetical protein
LSPLDRRPRELGGMLKTKAALRGWAILDTGTPVASFGMLPVPIVEYPLPIEPHPELPRKSEQAACRCHTETMECGGRRAAELSGNGECPWGLREKPQETTGEGPSRPSALSSRRAAAAGTPVVACVLRCRQIRGLCLCKQAASSWNAVVDPRPGRPSHRTSNLGRQTDG